MDPGFEGFENKGRVLVPGPPCPICLGVVSKQEIVHTFRGKWRRTRYTQSSVYFNHHQNSLYNTLKLIVSTLKLIVRLVASVLHEAQMQHELHFLFTLGFSRMQAQ